MPQGGTKIAWIENGTRPVNVPEDATIDEVREQYPDAILDSTPRFRPGDVKQKPPMSPDSGRPTMSQSMREAAELLPMVAAGAAIPFTGGMSVPAAMALSGGAAGAGSLGRSAILGEDLGTTARRAATEGAFGALGEGGGRLISGAATAGARGLARQFMNPEVVRQVPGSVDTLLAEGALRNPFSSPAGSLGRTAGRLEAQASHAVADPAVGGRAVPVFDYGRNMPVTRGTRQMMEGLHNNATDIAINNAIVDSVQNNPAAGQVFGPTGTVVGRRADRVVPFSAEQARRAAAMAPDTGGALNRALAQDAYNAAARTVPEAARPLERLSNMVPARQAVSGGEFAILDPTLKTATGKMGNLTINRSAGTLADLLGVLGRNRGAQSGLGDLTREAIIRLLEPAHQSKLSRGKPQELYATMPR